MFTIPASVTGAAVTGLTSPTYTVSAATGPETNSKRGVVSALGGTQTGVRTHAVSDQFDMTVWAPKVPKALPSANSNTGVRPPIPNNVHSIVVRKGLIPASGETAVVSPMTLSWPVPAGAESYDKANCAAQLSMMAGILWAKASELLDDAVTGSV